MRRGKYEPIESALGSAVRQIADGVITGQRITAPPRLGSWSAC
jgi:hypothetical protein